MTARKVDVYSWFRKSWIRLHEPRFISAFYGAWWSAVTALAGYSVPRPPRTIEAVAGDVLMTIISVALTLGGIIGMVSVARGAYWAERYAVGLVAVGFFGYIALLSWIWATGEGNRGLQLLGLMGATCLTVMRCYWVNEKPYSKERVSPARNDLDEVA